MTRPPARDEVIPGSARLVVMHDEYTVVTVRCGNCSNEQETRATAKTTRCRGCGRHCKVQAPAAPNVIPIPLRRSA